MTGKVKTNLNGTTVEQFMSMVEMYLDSLEKPVFSQIIPDIQSVREKLKEMKSLQDKVKEGSHKAVHLRNTVRKSINADMSRMCEWVNILAHGNIEILSQCAFERVKSRSASPVPPGIRKLIVHRSEERGKATVAWKGNGSKFYRAQMTLNPNEHSSWKDIATVTSNRCDLDGLPVGMFCYFRVQGVNATGAGEFSDICMYMAS
ncbi:MAG: fibronectin type III domain-containing protein [Flavobacteriales bacterium]|nr:fibronectin type III domain-containing protein [Flavobacteriales bacterium]